LHQRRFRGDGLGKVCGQLCLIAGRVGAGILLAEFGKQELVVACAFGAIDAASGCWHKLAVFLVEGRIFENEQDVVVDPELKIANR